MIHFEVVLINCSSFNMAAVSSPEKEGKTRSDNENEDNGVAG